MAEQSRGKHPKTGIRWALRAFWRGLREWCGDAAYELYLDSRTTRESAQPRLTPAEFYVERVNHRYSRPNRCC